MQKFLIFKNRTNLLVEAQVKKAFDFLIEKTTLPLEIEYRITNIEPNIQQSYPMPNGIMRYCARPDLGTETNVIFLYQHDEAYLDGAVTGDCFPSLNMSIPVNEYFINIDWLWKVIAHEMMHLFVKKLNVLGFSITDEMDSTWVNGILMPYYKNDDPYATDGNFAVMFKKLAPLWKNLINNTPHQVQPLPIQIPLVRPTLKQNKDSQDVTDLQTYLKTLGYLTVTPTGHFGQLTKQAVISFQKASGLVTDGIVGPKTWAAITSAIEGKKKIVSQAGTYMLYPAVERTKNVFMATCIAQGETLVVTEGYRSIERQNELYAQGRTAPGAIVTNAKGGESMHQYGVAFDVIFLVNGKRTYDVDDSKWQKIGAIGKSLELQWGGTWSNPDRPHFEMTLGYTLSDFQKNNIDWSKFS